MHASWLLTFFDLPRDIIEVLKNLSYLRHNPNVVDSVKCIIATSDDKVSSLFVSSVRVFNVSYVIYISKQVA